MTLLDRTSSLASPRRPIATRKPANKRSTGPIDTAIGAAIRLARLGKGLSQTDLGHTLKITFQQIQKYENGANRVAASRLMMIAVALDVPVGDLLGEAETTRQTGAASPTHLLMAKSEPARRLMVAVQMLFADKRNTAIADLARIAEQMMRAT